MKLCPACKQALYAEAMALLDRAQFLLERAEANIRARLGAESTEVSRLDVKKSSAINNLTDGAEISIDGVNK